MKSTKKIIVVGGGLSGLMATIKICESGGIVDLFSYCPVKRSHSLCAQGGINACMDSKGEHDTVWDHIDDTIYGGDFLADQLAVKGMCENAPKLIKMFDAWVFLSLVHQKVTLTFVTSVVQNINVLASLVLLLVNSFYMLLMNKFVNLK